MHHIRSLQELSLQKTWLTIGVFDGVHRGHQAILRDLVSEAKKAQATSLVISFHPHPATVLGKRSALKYLSLPAEKAEILEKLGVDILFTYPFDKKLAALTAENFMEKIQKRIDLQTLFIGYDFALGKDRQGNAAYLARLGQKTGYTLRKFDPLLDAGQTISSSRVRETLVDGRVSDAQRLLGRPYTLRGSVIRGDGRGRKINVPTANLSVNAAKLVPANGVYACLASVNGKTYRAVTNIGIRPTFTPSKTEANIETHLLNFNGDIYGKEMKLSFIARLRAEKKFSSVAELLHQIFLDIDAAKKIFSSEGQTDKLARQR
jgi:riboflavin kinase/FMN adenylyltransferase